MSWRGDLLEFGMTVKFLAVISLMMAASASSVAIASDVDWKFYGSSTAYGDANSCFFDLRGSVEAPDRHIKVWVKCLRMKAMESIDIKKDFGGKIASNAAQKFIDGYIPPISLVEDANLDKKSELAKFMVVTQFEEIADVSDIPPVARIFYELDCPKTMSRMLSVEVIDVDGRSGSNHSATEWKYVAPETNGARLQKILCDKSVAR
jgi:hypothetical protein